MDAPTSEPARGATPGTGAGAPALDLRVASSVSRGLRPVLLGLAGDSASGKSTLSRGIEYVLGVERVGRVCTDDYHRYDRATRSAMGVTPLVPDANRMDLMAEHLRTLASGAPVTKPTYDHHTGGFGPDETIEPGEIVIVEGLLPMVDRGTRDAIDVAVFLDPDEELAGAGSSSATSSSAGTHQARSCRSSSGARPTLRGTFGPSATTPT